MFGIYPEEEFFGHIIALIVYSFTGGIENIYKSKIIWKSNLERLNYISCLTFAKYVNI